MDGMIMDHLFHDVLQLELKLFQAVLLYFFLFREKLFGFKLFHLVFVFGVLVGELPEFLTRLHQMRFDVCFL